EEAWVMVTVGSSVGIGIWKQRLEWDIPA
ncbi:hypothetical protein EVA_04296, partial [gut metagenome]